MDAPQIGVQKSGDTDFGMGGVHPFGVEHFHQEILNRLSLDDDFLTRILGNVDGFGIGHSELRIISGCQS